MYRLIRIYISGIITGVSGDEKEECIQQAHGKVLFSSIKHGYGKSNIEANLNNWNIQAIYKTFEKLGAREDRILNYQNYTHMNYTKHTVTNVHSTCEQT